MTIEKRKSIEQHDEIWKFIKFSIAGDSKLMVQYLFDLMFHYLIFVNLRSKVIEKAVFRFHEIDSYMDAAIGYFVGYLINRKITFNSSSNLAMSIFLYLMMVIVMIFVTAWLISLVVRRAMSKQKEQSPGLKAISSSSS